MSHSKVIKPRKGLSAVSASTGARRSAARPLPWMLGVLAVTLTATATALAAAPRRSASYRATGAEKTVLTMHTSAHGRIATYTFKGTCNGGHGAWFFNSHGERAIPVTANGVFSLRRTEPNTAIDPTTGAPTPGTFTFTISGHFGPSGRALSGKLSFVSSSAAGTSCRTGPVHFHGSLVSTHPTA